MGKIKLSNLSRYLVLLLLVSSIFSCARQENPNIQRGSTYKFVEGYPEVRFSSVGFLNQQGVPTLNISANIVYGSLIYRKVNGKQQAQIDIELRIIQKQTEQSDSTIIDTKQYTYSFNKDNSNSNIINSQASFDFEKEIEVTPGTFTVYLSVTDKNSRKSITRKSTSFIPDPNNNVIDLTEIRMLGKDMDIALPKWTPINTYDVPQKIDSLMFVFQVTNNNSSEPLTINTELIQFESDSSFANPMFFNNATPSSIVYKGIDFSEETVIEESRRQLLQQGSVFIEFRFENKPRGNYRFQVTSNKQELELYKARDFGVKSKNYPALRTPGELARPLAYLMDEDEYKELMTISDTDSLKKAIDRFWLKSVGDKNKAVSVLKLYYGRVEEANKQFSNFKEGWKTDAGMLYILFGPPWYVDERLRVVLWGYSYDRSDPEYNFAFSKPRIQTEFYPFRHLTLNRSQSYYNVEYRQISLWTTGEILQGNI